MVKQYEEGNIELYFNDYANEKEVKQSFANLKPGVTAEQVQSFQTAVSGLVDLPAAYAVVVEKNRYSIA